MRAILTADRRFAILDVSFPVIDIYIWQTIGSIVDSEINVGKMPILLNFRPLPDTRTAGISIHNLISAGQIYNLRNIMPVCWGSGNCINRTAACIYADIALHAKPIFTSLTHFAS